MRLPLPLKDASVCHIIARPSLHSWKSLLKTHNPLPLWSLIYQPAPPRRNNKIKTPGYKTLLGVMLCWFVSRQSPATPLCLCNTQRCLCIYLFLEEGWTWHFYVLDRGHRHWQRKLEPGSREVTLWILVSLPYMNERMWSFTDKNRLQWALACSFWDLQQIAHVFLPEQPISGVHVMGEPVSQWCCNDTALSGV